MKKTLLVSAAVVAGLMAGPMGIASAGAPQPRQDDVTTIAVFGDNPYGTSPTDVSQNLALPGFVDSVNADRDVRLVLHVGDIHSGKQFCTQAYDQFVFDSWTRFVDPLVYTPGDNEWTDCHKKAEGGGSYNPATGAIDHVLDAGGNQVDYAGGDPAANLALVRSIFFAKPGTTLGTNARKVLSQATAYDRRFPGDKAFVENVLWEQNDVVFVTANVPGGSNNDQDVWYGAPTESPAQTALREARTGATLRWLDTAFAVAKEEHAKAVVITSQADMWDPEKGAAHQSGYEPIVAKVAALTTAFRDPVLMFNGDSHTYRSDNPLSPTAGCTWELATPCVSDYSMHPGYDVPNFHRVVVHGSTSPLEWLKLTIDTRANGSGDNAFGPFSWVRQPVA
jgi:hypothetical protein